MLLRWNIVGDPTLLYSIVTCYNYDKSAAQAFGIQTILKYIDIIEIFVNGRSNNTMFLDSLVGALDNNALSLSSNCTILLNRLYSSF